MNRKTFPINNSITILDICLVLAGHLKQHDFRIMEKNYPGKMQMSNIYGEYEHARN